MQGTQGTRERPSKDGACSDPLLIELCSLFPIIIYIRDHFTLAALAK